MIKTKKTNVTHGNLTVTNRVYSEFDTRFYEFQQINCNDLIKIKFIRAYAEDAKYADKTHLQLAVSAIKEIVETEKCDVILEIWGQQLRFLSDTDEYEIQETLIDFILRNAFL